MSIKPTQSSRPRRTRRSWGRPRRPVRLVAWSLAAAQSVVAPSLYAAAPSEADKDRAAQLMAEGDERQGEGSFAAALDCYQRADAIMAVPTTRIAVARALVSLGRLVAARDAAAQTARMPVARREPPAFVKARAEAARLLVDLDARTPSITVAIDGLPPGWSAEVAIDGVGQSEPQLGAAIRVDPGAHRLTASAPGCAPVVASPTLDEREARRVTLRLQCSPAAPVADGGADARSSGRATSPLAYVGLGLGAAGCAVGAATGILSITQANDLRDQCGGDRCPPDYEDDLQLATTLGWVSNIAFGVGGVGVIIGVVGLLLPTEPEVPASPSGSATRLRVAWGPAGPVLEGRF